jgi:hypothetical protein
MDRPRPRLHDRYMKAQGPDRIEGAGSAAAEQARWLAYLEALPLASCDVMVAVGPRRADDHPARARPLRSIRYDAQADEIEVAVGVGTTAWLRYFIAAPRSIAVDERPGGKVLRVVDADGVQTMIGLQGISPRRETPTPLAEVRSSAPPQGS